MERIPFSFYDFFGYLAPGFLVLGVFDFFINNRYLFCYHEKDLIFWTMMIGLAYILGQILAYLSSWIIEGVLISKNLKSPSVNLLLNRKKKRMWKKIFKQYLKPFPIKIRIKLLKKAEREKLVIPTLMGAAQSPTPIADEELTKELLDDIKTFYLHAYGRVKMSELAMTQQDIFLKLYGFGRNIAFSAFISLPVLVFRIFSPTPFHTPAGLWLILFLVASLAMFYIYLKFYRWYYREIFLAFGELPAQEE